MKLTSKVVSIAGCLCSVFLPLLHAQPQDVSFKRYDSEDGLEGSHISALLQDHRGFLWVGTSSGLFRFDGYTFKSYKSIPTDTTSLSDNIVNALYEDDSNGLWIGTTNGLNRFDYRTEKFTHYRNALPVKNPAGLNFVQVLAGSRNGEVLVGTHGEGLFKFHQTSREFVRLELPRGSLPTADGYLEISAILTDREGVLWLGTIQHGLFKHVPSAGTFEQFRYDPSDREGLRSNNILVLTQDRSGAIWVGTHKGGLARVNASKNQITTIPLPKSDHQKFSIIDSIVEDTEGILWLGTSGAGLIAYEPQSGRYRIYRSDSRNPHTLSNDWILSQYLDRAGNLWIGTNGGLSKLLYPRKKIGHLTSIPGDRQSLIHNNVNTITQDPQGNLWVGTANGISVFDADSRLLTHYQNDPDEATSLSQNFVQYIRADKYGDMWVGTFGGGLNRYNRRSRSFVRFQRDTSDAGSLSQNFVTSIYEDRAGDLWVGTLGGLNKFDRGQNRFTRYLSNAANSKALSHNGITGIFEDSSNRFWIATYGGGLNRMERESAEFTHYKNDRLNPQSLSDNIVFVITEDEAGRLWIGTNGGLDRFDAETGQFSRYSEQDGLPSNAVFGILCEGAATGNLWISTHNGLCVFNEHWPASRKFVNFEARKDGLLSNEFAVGAFYRSPNGEFFFGGPNGVNRFYPQDLKTGSVPPNIALTAFTKFNKAVVLDTAITEISTIYLSHDDDFFALEFAALDFTLPEKNEYAYRMHGFNQDWIYCGTQHNATFTNLSPGAYVFRVKGANSDGAWNETGAAVRIIIAPPFWQTWWFQLGAGLSIILLAAGFYRLRLAKLLAIERLRVRIASDLHDDIGATLTKISLHSELIQDSADSPDVRNSLRKIGGMSRELLTTMSDVVWSIDARNDTVGNLLDRMREFAASILSAKSVALNFNTTGLDLHKRLPVDLRQNLYLIFKEAINNVARHAEASRVDIRLENSNGQFMMIIHDDGKVLAEAEKMTGHGLRNMRMRAQRIGGELQVVKNGGYLVSLTAPALR